MACSCLYRLPCLRSCWNSCVQFFLSTDERIRARRRMVLGVLVLLLVDIIWVGSSELTDFIFHTEGFDKPFFTTYFKTSSFMVYLAGFLFYDPWKQQCVLCFDHEIAVVVSRHERLTVSDNCRVSISHAGEDTSLLQTPTSSRASSPVAGPLMGESMFETITDDELYQSNCIDGNISEEETRHVRFNSIREVRHLSENLSVQARMARVSHEVSDRLAHASEKLPIKQVAKVSFMFCLLWFFANFGYQQAIANTSPAAVNILSSSSGLFTLILASVFPSSTSDKFSLSKLLAVLVSITGIVLVTLSDSKSKTGGISFGALWALESALLYACYLTMLKKKVPDEGKIDIPMFFGLVGLFNCVLIWPGFFILHYSGLEPFELPPSATTWGYIILNALVGTVLSEVLWLWGCYLTSSLTATLSLSLIMPLTMLTDVFVKKCNYAWLFYVGTIPVFLSFFAVSLLSHYTDWDPVLLGLKRLRCMHKGSGGYSQASGEEEEQEQLITEEDTTSSDSAERNVAA